MKTTTTSHTAAASHGSLRGYMLGFALSTLLTLAAFGAVMGTLLPREFRLPAIVALCVTQLLAQLIFFLHLGARRGQRGNSAILVCTLLLIVIVVAGSLWVMHNANVNMMPTSLSPERALLRE